MRHLRIAAAAFALLLNGMLVWAQQPTHRPRQTLLTVEQERILASVETMFKAMAANDRALLSSVTETNFYLFDSGARFSGDSILDLLQQMRQSGTQLEWHVTNPDVHICGSAAWIAYVDRGSITNASGKKNMTWLESAFLVKDADQWKLAFMQSTPASSSKAE